MALSNGSDITHWFFCNIRDAYQDDGNDEEFKDLVVESLLGSQVDKLKAFCYDLFEFLDRDDIPDDIREAMVASVRLQKLKEALLVELGFATCYDCDKRTKDLFPWKDEDGEPDGTICCQDCISK